MNRTHIINLLINKIGATRYLEIGVSAGENFEAVRCKHKVGVDPEPTTPATLHMTSDDFFIQNKETFDVIFINGLHHADQVFTDIENALAVLNEDGYIVCHDMNPIQEIHQQIPFQGGHWNGDCWRALYKLRCDYNNIRVQTVDTDEGCAVIRRREGGEKLALHRSDLHPDKITYKSFDNNRHNILNLISSWQYIRQELAPLLEHYINDPGDCDNNFAMGIFYHSIGQTAAAVGFYIRAAERAKDSLLQYECMLRAAMCFHTQGIRKFSVKGMCQHAIALHPERPEAYYFLARITSNENYDGNWFDSYTWASLGVRAADNEVAQLKTDVEYPGKNALRIQQAHAAWWCGMCDEARDLFFELYFSGELTEPQRKLVHSNLSKMNGFSTKQIDYFTQTHWDNLRHKFEGSNKIAQNFSESYQDMFVLAMLDGKRNGTYLEIGAGNFEYGNNTALLERNYDWTGISIDYNADLIQQFLQNRKNKAILRDARLVDYYALTQSIGMDTIIDYLQFDCDPPSSTYDTLLAMPFDRLKFRVITYEHDYYCDLERKYRDLSRAFLESYGYVMVVNNIAPDGSRAYEDWWVHPDLVDNSLLSTMTVINDDTKRASDYMLGRL